MRHVHTLLYYCKTIIRFICLSFHTIGYMNIITSLEYILANIYHSIVSMPCVSSWSGIQKTSASICSVYTTTVPTLVNFVHSALYVYCLTVCDSIHVMTLKINYLKLYITSVPDPLASCIHVWPLTRREKRTGGLVHCITWSTSNDVEADIVLRKVDIVSRYGDVKCRITPRETVVQVCDWMKLQNNSTYCKATPHNQECSWKM